MPSIDSRNLSMSPSPNIFTSNLELESQEKVLYIFNPIGILNDVIVVSSFDFNGVLIDQDLFDFCHIFWRL